jgi:glycosyltransferase involved in cell wall biosynthesis
MKLSILIKTLNEEKNIERCLASVERACSGLGQDAEIIVADSLSSDRTVQIAANRGAKVVQLAFARDRGCGAGVQLGYQHSRGEYVMLLDGDMELDAEFIPAAIAKLDGDASLAGVAGQLEDTAVRNWFDRRRLHVKASETGRRLKWLPGGGMFRRRAIEEAGGYAGNRNLMAFEEAELGMRLNSRGWRQERLPCVGVRHTGHVESSIGLALRYWRSGRMDAAGVLLRQAFGQPWFWSTVRLFIHPIAVIAFWLTVATMLVAFPAQTIVAATCVSAFVFVALALKKRSIVDACLSLALWHLGAIGLVRGLFRRPISPTQRIESRVLGCD